VAGGVELGFEAKLLRTLPGQCVSLVFAPDGQHVAFVDASHSNREEVYVWETSGAASPRLLTQDISHGAQRLSFTPDSRQLVTVDASQVVITLDVATGKKVKSFPTIDANRPDQWNLLRECVCLSPDGTKLAFSSPSALGVDVWDLKTGRLLYSLPEQSGTVYWLAWSPDSQRLAVSRSNGDIAIWNLPEIERVLVGLGLSP
jgi:WD40 repeat protein